MPRMTRSRLDPAYALAFNNRGNARWKSGDLPGALADYDEAIRNYKTSLTHAPDDPISARPGVCPGLQQPGERALEVRRLAGGPRRLRRGHPELQDEFDPCPG